MFQPAVTADVVPDGLALMIGLGGRLGILCSGAVLDSGLRGVAVAHVSNALERIRSHAPRVVIIPGALTRHEKDLVREACEHMTAELIELPSVVGLRDVVHEIAKALAVSERRRRQSSVEITVR